ncbi:hypothetical protein AAHH67_19285 [Niallia circulans]
MAATVGQVHMYPEKTLERNLLQYRQNIVVTAVTLQPYMWTILKI